MSLRMFLAGAAFAALSLPAFAGEQYVDSNGFAVSGYDVTSYFDLDQAPVGSSQPAPVPGSAAITAEWNGSTWAFASAANRDKFLADPARYAPQYDGHCAFAVSKGGKAPGNPTLWRIVDGKLYLNVTKTVVGFWEEDIPGNISKAEGNWPTVEPTPASAGPVPEFTPAAPES
ncbi:YHS domain-containing (seleno)protein [Ovoidimarina sediminis]|uniref:YHS domain-containing (seleno)protein n=1 Tax=Ovoidimarina sediminis TaxID=3079856 RepID=UPI002907113A|nr:YHS domain-containing (seleno)protein [Rhodophyticola sp. MJ-SS7]MDU8945684.1 YHS domain-containing (seleno)protein [Rhodophyticola sp. MJ-SS7]